MFTSLIIMVDLICMIYEQTYLHKNVSSILDFSSQPYKIGGTSFPSIFFFFFWGGGGRRQEAQTSSYEDSTWFLFSLVPGLSSKKKEERFRKSLNFNCAIPGSFQLKVRNFQYYQFPRVHKNRDRRFDRGTQWGMIGHFVHLTFVTIIHWLDDKKIPFNWPCGT